MKWLERRRQRVFARAEAMQPKDHDCTSWNIDTGTCLCGGRGRPKPQPRLWDEETIDYRSMNGTSVGYVTTIRTWKDR